MLSVRTREKKLQIATMPNHPHALRNEMRAYLRFLRMASSVMWCIPPNVTEVLARFAKIFDPAQQCCIGARINVQKFEAIPPVVSPRGRLRTSLLDGLRG